MKFLVKIVVFLFVSFIALPTIVSMVDNKADTSYFFNLAEEEENHASLNEIKSVHQHNDFYTYFLPIQIKKADFYIFDETVESSFLHSIKLPPPELV